MRERIREFQIEADDSVTTLARAQQRTSPDVGHVWPYCRQNFTEFATKAVQKQ